MSDSRDDDSSGGQRRYNLRDRSSNGGAADRQGDDDDNGQNDDLTTILRYLVRTGQVRLMSSRRNTGETIYVSGGSIIDDEVDDDDDEYRSNSETSGDDDQIEHQPEADPSPDIQNLRSSDFMQEILHNSGRGPLSNVTTCCIPKPSLRCLVGNYLVSTNTMSATNSAQDLHQYPESARHAPEPSASTTPPPPPPPQQSHVPRLVGCACFGRLRKRVQESSLEDVESKPIAAHFSLQNRPLPYVLRDREAGVRGPRCKSSRGNWMLGDRSAVSSMFLPNRPTTVARYTKKAFCGSFSTDGREFLSACQDTFIRAYDCTRGSFREFKGIRARDVGWAVLDTAFSPDGLYFIYSSWSSAVHICNIHGETQTQTALDMRPQNHRFACFSIKFSHDNREVLGGANDGAIYVYDREAAWRTIRIQAHEDDVNAVSFADDASQILFSGGDDGFVKVWDRRTLDEAKPKPVGVLTGHTDGITFVDSKGDGRYLISNGKDQTLKLWDIRRFGSQDGVEQVKKAVHKSNWDYRWEAVPKRNMKKAKISGDVSVMTYRGHGVLCTLIRCYFSPSFTTGQRYVYSGCSTGRVVIWDVLTGEIVSSLSNHRQCCRDVSWHPFENKIVSTSWDGTLCMWDYHREEKEEEEREDEEEQMDTSQGKRDEKSGKKRTFEPKFKSRISFGL